MTLLAHVGESGSYVRYVLPGTRVGEEIGGTIGIVIFSTIARSR